MHFVVGADDNVSWSSVKILPLNKDINGIAGKTLIAGTWVRNSELQLKVIDGLIVIKPRQTKYLKVTLACAILDIYLFNV
jgi:hypothetical protein